MAQKELRDTVVPWPHRAGRMLAMALMLCSALVHGNEHRHGGTGITAAAGGPDDARLRTLIRSDDGLHVEVVLSNEGDRPVTVLTRDTPLDTRRLGAPLTIERAVPTTDDRSPQWQPVVWQGRLTKRMPPGPDELVALAPGESVSARIALDDGWHIERAGDHRIALAAPWRTAPASPRELVSRSISRGQRLDHDLIAQPMPSSVQVALLDNASPLDALLRLRTPQYSQCSAEQQQDIVTAAGAAERLVGSSVAALRGLSGEELARSPRYNTWFGQYDPQRAANVIADLSAVADTLADDTVRFNCDCAEAGVFAYVFPTRPYDVWLCPAFWRAGVEGTDSRAGTVVHELSHFRIVAGTSDHVYTQGRAQQLADDNPDLAIDNADSFEYFVENTPAIALRADGQGDQGDQGGQGTGSAPTGVSTETLRQGQARRYAIRRGRSVQVESFEGDADLLLYRGDSIDERDLLCESDEVPTRIDRCQLEGPGPWTAEVVAFTDTRYRLSITDGSAGTFDEPSDDDPVAGFGGTGGDGGGVGASGPLAALVIALLAGVRRYRPRRAAPALLLACAAGSGCASPVDPVEAGAGHGIAGPEGAERTGATPVDPGAVSTLEMSLAGDQPDGSSVRVTVYNPAEEPARMLAWNTPFEPVLSADVFVVRANGKRAAYTGRLVKRALPAPDEAWMTLQPGERRSTELDLARYYAIEHEGPWQVRLDAERLQVSALESAAPISVPADDAPILLP